MVHAFARFLAQRTLIDQRFQPRRRSVILVPRVIGQRVLHGVDHVRKRIEPHHISGAKRRAFWTPNQGTGQRIDGVETDGQTLGVINRRQHGKYADAVGDEVGRVLGADHALAERGHQKFFEIIEDARLGVLACDQLDQMHVARRIEKMHAAKTVAQPFGKRLRQRIDRQSRRVAGKDRVLAQMRRDFFVEIGLPIHALGNRLDHDVAFL